MRTACCARTWSLVLSATCSVAVAACEDSAAPSSTVPPEPTGPVSFYITPSDTSWDYFAADVDVTLESPPPELNYTGPPTYRYMRYHAERTRGANNVWSSVVTFDPYVPHGAPVPPNAPAGLLRLEDDDVGSYTRLYDHTGAPVSVPSGVFVEAGVSPADTLPRNWGSPPGGASAASIGANISGLSLAMSGTAGRREFSRAEAGAWLDQIVITPGRRPIRLQRIQRQLGDAVGSVRGLRRYLKRNGRFVHETLVDDAIGAVLEVNVARDGQLLHRTLYGYTSIGEGRFVRTHTRIERPRPGQPDRPTVMEHVISNVRVERRGTR